VNQPLLVFPPSKIGQEDTALVLPAHSSRRPGPGRRFRAAGVEFLLLHLPLTFAVSNSDFIGISFLCLFGADFDN
jgi:hypothetical protein